MSSSTGVVSASSAWLISLDTSLHPSMAPSPAPQLSGQASLQVTPGGTPPDYTPVPSPVREGKSHFFEGLDSLPLPPAEGAGVQLRPVDTSSNHPAQQASSLSANEEIQHVTATLQDDTESLYSVLLVSPGRVAETEAVRSREPSSSCWGRCWKRILVPALIGIPLSAIGLNYWINDCADSNGEFCLTGKVCASIGLALTAPLGLYALARLGICAAERCCMRADDLDDPGQPYQIQ